ncbi:MAG: hypothetical protein AB1894_27845 [Chloroflexota bacterium]
MYTRVLIDILGWAGVALLLLAYGLVSMRKLPGDSNLYQALNLAGGAMLIANSFYFGAIPSVVVNLFWIAIAVFTLARKRRPQPTP